MLKNVWLCFRTSSPFVGNNPSLQTHSFSEDLGKCNKTGNPSISNFSTILTSHILILAGNSHHLPSDEAYRQRLSLPCYRLLTPCYKCKPNERRFSTKFSLKRDSAGVSILSHDICRFQAPSSFPSYLLVPASEMYGFILTKHKHIGEEEKPAPSSVDISSPMIAPPVSSLQQSAFCTLKKQIA
jgi:hypothetical protein